MSQENDGASELNHPEEIFWVAAGAERVRAHEGCGILAFRGRPPAVSPVLHEGSLRLVAWPPGLGRPPLARPGKQGRRRSLPCRFEALGAPRTPIPRRDSRLYP